MKIGLVYFEKKVRNWNLHSMCNNLSFSIRCDLKKKKRKPINEFLIHFFNDSQKVWIITFIPNKYKSFFEPKRIEGIEREIQTKNETDPRKQSHPFGDRYPRSRVNVPPLARS